jgi:YD repeat-containing protein
MTHSNRWPLVVGATTVVTAGMLAAPIPAHAVPLIPLAPPACLQYAFAGPTAIVSNGRTVVTFNATGPNVATTTTDNLPVPINGFVDANKFVSLSLSMPGPPPATETYSGAVGDDGIARGKVSNTSPIVQSGGDWSTAAPLKCDKEAAPEAAPKEGPTVSFDPILGGLNVHITDRSGVTSQCTYDADGFTRAFRLEANKSTDLKIVPAIPKFDNWNITITCDNGTSTKTTQFF